MSTVSRASRPGLAPASLRPVRVLAAMLALGFGPGGATAAPLDRASVLERAWSTAPEAAAVRATEGEADRWVAAAGGAIHAPRLEFEVEGDGIGPFAADSRAVRLGLTQELDVRNVRGARRDRARAERAAVEAGDAARRLEVLARSEEAFGAWLVARRLGALADSTAAASGRVVAAARRAARAEALSPYALRQIELVDAAARAGQAAARGEAETAAARVRLLVGAPDDEALEPVDDLAGDAWSCAPERMLSLALRHRPDLAAARALEEEVEAGTRLAVREGAAVPEIGLFVARSRERVDRDAFGGTLDGVPGFDGFTDTGTTLGASLSWPLPFARPTRAEASRGAIALSRARAARLRVEADARADVRAACAALAAAAERRAILEASSEATRADGARLESAYREGRVDLDAYLSQRERLLGGMHAAIEALAAYDAARLALARATGLTTPQLRAALDAPPGDER